MVVHDAVREMMLQEVRAFAEALLKERGLDLVLRGPYRWGAVDAPPVHPYISQSLPRAERLIFFLGAERAFNGLKSSTLIPIDEQGPQLVLLTSANDEG
jgi:hypothetical protein